MTNLRCARYNNDERNAYTNAIFIQHLKANHTKASDDTTTNGIQFIFSNHTCIIESSMRYKHGKSGPFNRNMRKSLLDECGDAIIKNSSNSFVEPALKFFITSY